MDNFVWGTKVVTTFLYDDFGAVTNETVLGVAGTNTIERYYDSVGRSLGYGCVDWQMAVVDAVNDSADANSSCFKAIGVGALYPFTKWTIHNWAKIFGPDVPYLLTPYIRRFKGIEIDPWPSGGARLFPDSFRDIDLPTYWK